MNEFSSWAWNSCGIVALQMILQTERNFSLTTRELINEALALTRNNFDPKVGWRHQNLVALAQKHGWQGKIVGYVTIYRLAKEIFANHYFLGSIKSPRGGHLCLFYGVKTDEKGRIKSFFYHDPFDYGKPKKAVEIGAPALQKCFQNKGIAIFLS